MRSLNCFLAAVILLIITSSEFMESHAEHKYKYLALGDSYTIGESVDENQRFPVQLSARLRSDNIDLADPLIIAKTGWTTDELMSAINEKNLTGTYDFVTLLIGVNNQYRGRSIENYREEFKTLLNKAISFAGGDVKKVLVISIPDWGVTPFAKDREADKIAKEIDEFNNINKTESISAGVNYSDITTISRKAKDDATLVAPDGLHPSGKMYTQWVDKFYSDVKNIFK
jgi:lysophospholipase L1-like esterase